MRFLLLLLTTWCGTAVALDTVFAPTPQHTLTPPYGATGTGSSWSSSGQAFFGQAVAISENYAVVGDGKRRRVQIYKKSASGSWGRIQEINYLANPPTQGTGGIPLVSQKIGCSWVAASSGFIGLATKRLTVGVN